MNNQKSAPFKIRLRRFAIILCGMVIILAFLMNVPPLLDNYRMRRALCQNGLNMISTVGEAVNEYTNKHNHMPNAAHWIEDILANNQLLSRRDFRIGQLPNVKCAIAYNQHLSDAEVNEIPQNVVVLFEADGEMNLTGDGELLQKPRAKDSWFNSIFSEEKFVFIYFRNGTIAKYRLSDGAISIYEPEGFLKYVRYEDKNFLKYTKDNKYFPLQWLTTE